MKLMEFIVENDNDLPDGLLAESAINELTKLKNRKKPFLMGLGFFKPHLPFVAPKKDWNAFEKIEIPIPDEKNLLIHPSNMTAVNFLNIHHLMRINAP